MLDIGRKHDLEELTRELYGATGMKKRDIEESISAIMNESGYTRSMRERLIKEARDGRFDNVKDISDQVARSKNVLYQ